MVYLIYDNIYTQSYLEILLANNNLKPICSLHFNGKNKLVPFFNNGKEEKLFIDNNNELHEHASIVISVVRHTRNLIQLQRNIQYASAIKNI